MSLMEIKIPDIGDFKSVDVTEILVKPGDRVEKESSLITVESDKSSMEIPSPVAGVVQGLRVRIGDKVSEGTVIVVVEASDAASATPAPSAAPAVPASALPVASVVAVEHPVAQPAASYDCDLLVLGAGPGGYSAAFRAADLGKKVVLVERYATLGGVCLNVGCIPSKALLHAAKVVDDAASMAEHGISFGAPKIDMDKLRDWKSKVVGKLTTGLAGMAKARKVSVLQGFGQFTGPNTIELQQSDGKRSISFASAIIAVGSQRTPAARPGIALAGAIGINHHLLSVAHCHSRRAAPPHRCPPRMA